MGKRQLYTITFLNGCTSPNPNVWEGSESESESVITFSSIVCHLKHANNEDSDSSDIFWLTIWCTPKTVWKWKRIFCPWVPLNNIFYYLWIVSCSGNQTNIKQFVHMKQTECWPTLSIWRELRTGILFKVP